MTNSALETSTVAVPFEYQPRLHQICNCVSGPQSTSSLPTHLGHRNGWVNVMKNNLLWFHVITGHHADTRTGVYISVAWQADTPSLPIRPGKGLMGRLYCGAHGCWCLLLPAPVTTLFNKHEPIFRAGATRMVPLSPSLMETGRLWDLWLSKDLPDKIREHLARAPEETQVAYTRSPCPPVLWALGH